MEGLAAMTEKKDDDYDPKAIELLRDLKPTRKRPVGHVEDKPIKPPKRPLS